MSEPPRERPLEAPAVAPSVYDEAYYLEACAGAAEWRDDPERGAEGYYTGYLRASRLVPGEVLVDLGCGRGELVAMAVEAGAARAVGVEYSEDALRLARRTFEARGVDDRAQLVRADARAVPLEDGLADVVTLLDVVEHLTPRELAAALGETRRLLRPGGRVLVHTLPNRLIYDVTYRLQRALRPDRRRRWPADPRNDFERAMHVNEQTRRSLAASLRAAGFERVAARYGAWIHDEFVPDERARRLYRRLATRRLTRPLGAADLWAEGVRPARDGH